MAFEVLFVFLAMLMVTETERARHLPTRRRLCLCADRVLPLRSFSDGKESSFVSCKEWCSTKDFEGKMSSHLRIRRNDVEGFTECPPGLDHIEKKWHIKRENIRVHFHDIKGSSRWLVQVSWSPFIGSTKGWDKYYMRYFTGEGRSPYQNFSCLILPKNRTSVNIMSSYKERKITLIVTALPNIRSGTKPNLVLEPFTPTKQYGPPVYTPGAVLITSKPTSEPFIPTFDPIFPTEGTEKSSALAWPIIGGAFAGLVLIFAMMWAFMWRKKTLRPFYRRDSQLQEINPKTDISGDLHLPEVYTRENISRDPQLQEVITKANIARDPQLSEVITKTNNIGELYYSCYYPENESFRTQVASIVNSFRKQGYNVIMDAMVTNEISSQGPPRWAENQIKRAKKVLVFLSPGLLELASSDGREIENSQDINRVWIELEVLRDIYSQNRSASKMVCIALPDMPVSSKDSPVWLKVSYRWPVEFTEILKRLNDRPSIKPA